METTDIQKEQFKQYYRENKERWKKYRKPPKTEEDKLASKLKKMQWKENHPEIYLWSNAKYRAKKEGIEFNIEVSDVVIPEFCPYLGLKLDKTKGRGHNDSLMSLDKIDPKKGYIKGNIEVISYKANRMKNDASLSELITFASKVLEKYAKENLVP